MLSSILAIVFVLSIFIIFQNDTFVKIGESIAKKAKTINDNADFNTFLNNSVSQSIALQLPQPIEIFNIINSLNHKKQ